MVNQDRYLAQLKIFIPLGVLWLGMIAAFGLFVAVFSYLS